jgi:hypothetical protein
MFYLLRIEGDITQYCAGDKIEKSEMGWACSADGEGRGM